MNLRVFVIAAVVSTSLNAQTFRRQAAITGGGDRDHGRCMMEVVVDGAAEISIRNDDATVVNEKGQAPEVRRFECTSPLPPNPAEFRYNPIKGRGRQLVVRPAADGQPAVIRIEDPQNGADLYAFELTWRAGFGPGPGPVTERRDGDFRGIGRRFTTEQALDVCKDAVRRQAADRMRTDDINFREIRLDDQPGRNDWVVGTVEARHPGRPDEIFRFSCSVNFDTGVVRSAQIDAVREEMRGDMRRPEINPVAVQNCQRAVRDRVRRDGVDRVEFGEIRMDDRPGRNEFLLGDFRSFGPRGPEQMRFSCSVSMRDGDVRSVDVVPAR
jgi:hypothetical protein